MATQGPNSPGTMADDAAVGTVAWSNPDNAKVSDGVYAVAAVTAGTTSHYLKATNFGFSIPAGATVNGIVVEVEKRELSAGDVKDNAVRIVKGGTIGSTDKSNASNWPSTDTYISYGSSSDLWGLTWLYSDINDSTFGAAISAKETSFDSDANADVDYISITVYYTPVASRSFGTINGA